MNFPFIIMICGIFPFSFPLFSVSVTVLLFLFIIFCYPTHTFNLVNRHLYFATATLFFLHHFCDCLVVCVVWCVRAFYTIFLYVFTMEHIQSKGGFCFWCSENACIFICIELICVYLCTVCTLCAECWERKRIIIICSVIYGHLVFVHVCMCSRKKTHPNICFSVFYSFFFSSFFSVSIQSLNRNRTCDTAQNLR